MVFENSSSEEFNKYFYRAEPEVLYDTGSFSILWKPHNMPCAPLRENENDTLLSWYLYQSGFSGGAGSVTGKKPVERGLLHRLDTPTAGLVLIAKKQESFDFLSNAQKAGMFQKTYKAFCVGNEAINCFMKPVVPVEKELFPLCDFPVFVESQFRVFGPGGREVRPVFPSSRYWEPSCNRNYRTEIQNVMESAGTGCCSFICSLSKGFRHQVRSHLAACGFPICGDRLYNPFCRLCGASSCCMQLFAVSLSFPDPDGKGTIFFSLPPTDKTSL